MSSDTHMQLHQFGIFFPPSQTFLKEDSLECETKIWKDCKAFSSEEESLNVEVTKAGVPKDFKLVEGWE